MIHPHTRVGLANEQIGHLERITRRSVFKYLRTGKESAPVGELQNRRSGTVSVPQIQRHLNVVQP
ncbi:MAG: hypothetical protein Q7Q71_02775 [Verrucomicrobiota bacterium JB023]|nr:hypothetical protein [Verrucomicrobiota bacterium JB023]